MRSSPLPPPPAAVGVPELALTARAAAFAEVSRLLQHPEHLRRLPQLLAEYEAKRKANAARLSSAVGAQVDAARATTALLAAASSSVARLRECYKTIDKICIESSSLVERPETISALATAHAAAREALRGARAVAALPEQAARAETMLRVGDAAAAAAASASSSSSLHASLSPLSSSIRLAEAYECISCLEGTAAAAARALAGAAAGAAEAEKGGGAGGKGGKGGGTSSASPASPSSAPLEALAPYIARVRAASRLLEDRLWSRVRAFRELCRTDPGALVDAARVIEAQERVDRHLVASSSPSSILAASASANESADAQGSSSSSSSSTISTAAAAGRSASLLLPLRPKRWWRRLELQVAASVQESFAPLLAAASRLPAAGEDTAAGVRALLEGCQAHVAQLADVFDRAAPCFARPADFFVAAAAAVHDGCRGAVDAAAAAAPSLASADILAFVAWADAYAETLADLGVGGLVLLGSGEGSSSSTWTLPSSSSSSSSTSTSSSPLSPPPGSLSAALAPLREEYRRRVRSSLASWCANMLRADLTSEPRQDPEGLLWTPSGATDLFASAHEQLQVVEDATRGELLLGTAADVLGAIAGHQAALASAIVSGSVNAAAPNRRAAAAAALASAASAEQQQQQQQHEEQQQQQQQQQQLPSSSTAAAAAATSATTTMMPFPPSPSPFPSSSSSPAPLSDGLLCALVNSNAAAYREALEFGDSVDASLEPALRGKVGLRVAVSAGEQNPGSSSSSSSSSTSAAATSSTSTSSSNNGNIIIVTTSTTAESVELISRGFLDLASAASRELCARVFADAALGDLFAKVGCSAEWRSGAATGDIVATLSDYLEDYSRLVEAPLFRRLAEGVLAEAAAHFAAGPLALAKPAAGGSKEAAAAAAAGEKDAFAAVANKAAAAAAASAAAAAAASFPFPGTTTTTIATAAAGATTSDAERIRSDAAALESAPFAAACRPEAISRALRPLADVAALVAADGADAAALAFTALLQAAPRLPAAAAERALLARGDLSRSEAKEAAALCREAAAARKAAAAAASSALRGGGGGGGDALRFSQQQQQQLRQGAAGGGWSWGRGSGASASAFAADQDLLSATVATSVVAPMLHRVRFQALPGAGPAAKDAAFRSVLAALREASAMPH